MAKSDYQIPFDDKGNLVGYQAGYRIEEWRDNTVFEDTLTFAHFERGRSAAHAIFTNQKEQRCQMFLTDLGDAIPRFTDGKLQGFFTYCKRGRNYGIRLAKVSEIKKQAKVS